ncbi:hypothetical protein [Arsenophonus endosymbiont of Bemisia tabaci]|nr:hypothetical protein [Arsenophonus endosymbiont of Bemisia tabaci]
MEKNIYFVIKIKSLSYIIQMLTKKSVQRVLAFVRRPFGKLLKNGIDL